MADATLYSIDAALFAALSALQINVPTGVTAARPFALVARYAGPPTPEGFDAVGAQYPCALLACEGEADDRVIDAVGSQSEERVRCAFVVYVALEDPRAIEDGIVGTTNAPGMYTLCGQVTGALNALFVAGLWRGRKVRHTYSRPVDALIRRGVAYVYALGFEALRVAEQATDVDTSPALASIDGDENLQGTADTAPNPIETFRTTIDAI